MSIPLTIGSDTFNYPSANESPGWGEDASAWAEAVTQALANISSATDVPLTQVAISDNASGATVAGLTIDPTTVRSAVVTYNCYRKASTTGPDYSEAGTVTLAYQNLASSTEKWVMSQVYEGNAGISFDIDDTGQVTYSTIQLSATGLLTFKAVTIPQTL